ncbi:tRNA uridine-5-carboxymethylaminomethyl(34) synthesis GTPase MnmE [Lactobacillus iners]|uniref:tRNA uridine-5-carboxymethylaminomethyl(34) synthesis GTPase MnmE n=1 Tax=Lactobacillus iners TaxID=147802 RepID=UPI001F08E18A|nr:tRNA uridine-5-carboxymethylaminomethyl(34) synthesis GTPase MnmE [Lactobacillus iners]MCT7734213.1 tRNA uridine-5-carboxymethylaminomethyl(34) synthesis GTPase MnmE [Lactobacillus iners]MCT7791331.1 tRNA uridine-5-carboxymethylaminomethyl(34) synthesis GTPase MnmE [Lactobacillus iners]MCT7809631.1 tRNA uridine-5-carboxymethylaminomethyl(34) synthesis GTPase MnmE [Lactobacillus iners]MCT7810052.1 tRNA uridine-5-carboxymethylaminomethyl(34) synthesis GTPase MnmE [Lactobacillus iners]MCT78379
MVQVLTQYDTIAAIATPIGEGGISIIRVSGENALEIVNKIFRGANLNKVASHTIHYGHIIDYANKDVVDEVLVTVMLAPKTFTRENTVEVSCHGGLLVTQKILQLILDNGARMATPGEFTKRAFINGRIDLTQAESIMDIIEAKTDRARQVAMNQLEGGLLFEIRKLRQELLNTMAHEEVNIDYPEYDMDDVTSKEMYDKAQQVIKEIDKLLATAQEGKVVRSGLATAIVGRPNVGKSSLLNYLSKEEKAIVTNIAGTTRDTLEEYVSLKGILLKLIDTAGIRQTDDIVEKIGVERSKRAITESDLVLLLINSSEELTEEDQKLLELTQDKKRIVILNKADQVAKITKKDIQKITDSPIVTISVLKKQNMIGLEEAIKSLFLQGITDSKSEVMVTNQRQNDLLRKAKQSLIEAIEAINDNMPLDLVQIDLKEAWDSLGEITGDTAPDELITQLFSKFCLGK